MKQRYLVILWSMLLGVTSAVSATAFGAGSTFINAPWVTTYRPGNIQAGVLLGVTPKEEYQFDYKFGFSLTEYLNVGFIFLRASTVVANFQATVVDLPDYANLKVGFGVLNLTADKSISTWEEENSIGSNHLIHYMGFGMDFWGAKVTGGAIKRREPTSTRIAKSILNSGYFGISLPVLGGDLMAESDGQALSVGYGQRVNNDEWEWKVAVSSPISRPTANATREDGAFLSIQLQRNIDMFESYTREYKKLKKSIDDHDAVRNAFLKSQKSFEVELENLKQTKNTYPTIFSPTASMNEDMTPLSEREAQSFAHYQKAQAYYANRQSYQALQELEKAMALMPQQSLYPAQVGSIYFNLGNRNSAMKYWARAYRLDPGNIELSKLPKSVFDAVKLQAKKQGE